MSPEDPTPDSVIVPKRDEGESRTQQRDQPVPELAYSAHRHRAAWSQATDLDLLLGLKRSDETALDELISRKTAPLVQLVFRIVGDTEEARDIVQVTFFKLWEARDRFDDRWSPNTWIYRIASNLAIDHFRSKRSRERVAEPVRHHLRAVADTRSYGEHAQLADKEVASIFQELAADLSEKQRQVFLLREVEGLPSNEVAEIVGCQESTVRNHLFNARKHLKTALLARYPEYASRLGKEARP